MTPVRGVVVVLALLCVFVGDSFAWGPLSHYHFARTALSPRWHKESLKQGCDMPDSYYFANFAEFPTCTISDTVMHTPITAGYFVKYALTLQSSKTTDNGTNFDPLSFALGFGSHMIADLVGFHSAGGYLGSTVQNWITFFPFMSAIDAFLLATRPGSFSPADLALPWATEAAAAFVVAASDYYRSNYDSKFPSFNETAVLNCIMPWQTTQDELLKIAQKIQGPKYFQSALVFWDQFNATTYDQASKHYALAEPCILSAINYWTNEILNTDPLVTPVQAFSATAEYVNTLFAKGACRPKTMTRP